MANNLEVWTIGHSTHPIAEFIDELCSFEIICRRELTQAVRWLADQVANSNNGINERAMTPGEHERVYRCERCDRETGHVVESIGADNRLHHACWDCVERHDKRNNLKPGWRRAHRTRRY